MKEWRRSHATYADRIFRLERVGLNQNVQLNQTTVRDDDGAMFPDLFLN